MKTNINYLIELKKKNGNFAGLQDGIRFCAEAFRAFRMNYVSKLLFVRGEFSAIEGKYCRM
jgi:hypothetical protein